MTDLSSDQDPFALSRFVAAQAPVYAQALAEIAAGRKRSHWMWFVFPQLRGLGRSAMAERYGMSGRAEAAAYLAHPVLGPRLGACVTALLRHEGRSATEIFGSPDDLKLHSSLTLFLAAGAGAPFRRALEAFYAGRPDQRTLALLASAS